MKIFLIGFMGCGKSFIGKRLAERLNMPFIDMDEYLQNAENQTIANIFTQYGEAYFRRLEKEKLREMLPVQNAVIATGGGAPCFHDNMAWMNQNGITIYLQASTDLLFGRLKSESEKRPVLGGRSDEALKQFISSKIEERNVYYSQCRWTILQGEGDAENILKQIIALHSSQSQSHSLVE
jgi:shikimate kinase